MVNTFRKNGGYTLVELLVTISVGFVAMLAAVTILLFGLNINRLSLDTASRQTTVRILLSSMEDLATQGAISKVEADMTTWTISGEDGVLYSYDSADQKIYGPSQDGGGAATAIMDGVITSDVTMDGQLLTVSVETEDGTYSSTVYCRMNEVEQKIEDTSDEEVKDILDENEEQMDPRAYFLRVLATQYSITGENNVRLRNPGLILDTEGNGIPQGGYYSKWYIEKQGGIWLENGWNPNTPWCACYISWALDTVWKEYYKQDENENPVQWMTGDAPYHANVDYFMNYLKKGSNGHKWQPAGEKPVAGDLIFFDWKVNSITDPEHIGAVIKVEGDWVYTIEGNSSNRVAIRKYKYDDPRIIGYGVLNWTLNTVSGQ